MSVAVAILRACPPSTISPRPPPAAVSVPSLTAVEAKRMTAAVAGSKAENTRRAYVSDWRRFESWCAARGHQAMPAHPVTIAAYISNAAAIRTPAGERAYAPSTLSR